ncbi:uncharacterized protein [Littorina saxatilis]|uniref:Uncharacterized protein n=1 Tax=Littorina saxatilis TaxID=31220 RepID=A0AAN9G558_9CAEN
MASDDMEPTSGDFMVLDSTTDREGLSPGEQFGVERQEHQRSEAITRLCGMCGTDDGYARPLRVVVVGKHGAGKSSFIDSVAAAVSEDKWHEYAHTGYRLDAGPITIVNQRHPKCCNEGRDRYKSVLLPTLIDVAGLGDDVDDKTEELLRLLFYGHLQEDEPIMQAYEECKKWTQVNIRKKYSQSYPDMRVDRIIFVASAADNLPTRLMSCVYRAAQPAFHRTERRAVPLYGVLTKMDKVDVQSVTFKEKKDSFMKELGLILPRLLVCSNYCDDLDPDCERTERLRPDLDLPIVRFLQQVCDKARKVIKEGEVLPGSEGTREEAENAENAAKQAPGPQDHIRQAWQSLDPMQQDVVTSAVVGLVTLLVMFFALPSAGQVNTIIHENCRNGVIDDPKVCDNLSHGPGFLHRLRHFFAAVILSLMFFGYRQFIRRA